MTAPLDRQAPMSSGEAAEPLTFDIREIPFSTRGSWINLSPIVGLHTTADQVHLVSHVNGMHPVFRLGLERDGAPLEAQWWTCPSHHEWRTPDAVVAAAFDGPRTLRLRGRGAQLRLTEAAGELTPFTGGYLFLDPVDQSMVLTSYETGRRYCVRMLRGELSGTGTEALGRSERSVLLGDRTGDWEAELVEATTGVRRVGPRRTFEELVEAGAEAFATYAAMVAPWRSEDPATTGRATYTLWSATVAPEGMLGRESVLMSKHWMDKLWSWDNCFNALALAPGLPDLALDQFLAPFDHQDEWGALPDSITHSEALYNYVKPPIHGWAFARLRQASPRALSRPELELVHDRLSRWSDYWLTCRRVPGHVLPYYQHGNDSGWDNATTFDLDRVVEAPDLAAFLAVQLDVLAGLARELGHRTERWERESEALVAALLDQLWTPEGFVAVGASSGRRSGTTSLLTLLPLLLGDRLPADVRRVMADKVREHLTDHGLATELPSSPQYEEDGYWRGPVWAPSTALIEAGLRRSGYDELADEVSRRFRALCERSGFAENFGALTGAGLRDRAYTWTAAVYLTLSAAAVGAAGGDLA
ncbi:MAG TPA: trehalase family glycosidase [Nocardioides sp.]|uniref:amylo-alpha-1,6-glucosidase n=1 Tax=Nocardioides sp. TaxID=35761 RepID=UPI002E32236D|nr:trehalase family glycosidase [Nocardioides sp.]HEX5088037.1 trehalase family glycosidase [Nocardioides sp.]